ncbi:MAG: ABC transporter ATP-binding protein [Acetobacteraceae bacterium]
MRDTPVKLRAVPQAPERPALVEAEEVCKRYGDLLALDRIDLAVQEREFVSILGPSGCGKSTFLRCIAGLDMPSSGTIRVAGEIVTKSPQNLGMVFQRDVLLDWRTILDNVFLPIDFRHEKRVKYQERARELLALFGLSGFEHSYPNQLSGGMRQRAAICRALINDPNLLLMDEPFGALDALTRDQLNVELQRSWAAAGRTIVFVTHSIAEAVFLSDRVAVFSPRPGRVALERTISLPRPRKMSIRQTPEFNRYIGEIRELFNEMGLLKEE